MIFNGSATARAYISPNPPFYYAPAAHDFLSSYFGWYLSPGGRVPQPYFARALSRSFELECCEAHMRALNNSVEALGTQWLRPTPTHRRLDYTIPSMVFLPILYVSAPFRFSYFGLVF
jgi:hypothetical protein